jgi:ornithine cyclodeaminase
MPGALTDPAVFGAKLVSLYPHNSQGPEPRPTIQGHVLLFEGNHGRPLALIEAASLTAIRTAAASAAATSALAASDARTLALLGYGVQAVSHLEAMCAVRPIERVRVWGPDADRAAAFAVRQQRPDLEIEAAASVEDAVREADLVCAVSGASTPILHGEWLAPGVHVNLVGAHSADCREADGRTLARARIFTEISGFALAEAGDIVLAIEEGAISADKIAGEIGDVHAGRLEGRQSADQITLYKSLGNTAQDLIAAHQVWLGD